LRFCSQHAPQSAFAFFAISCDQVDEDCTLKELEQFVDGARIRQEL
jgi:hypothetical protein